VPDAKSVVRLVRTCRPGHNMDGGSMGLLAKTAWAMQVLATAAMTLIAGIPHFDCLCTDNRAKPFSVLPSSGSQCCCGRCRSSTDAGAGSCCSPSCCNRSRHSSTIRSLPGRSQLGHHGCCVKTLAQPVNAMAGKTVRAVSKDLTPGEFLSYRASYLCPWLGTSSGRSPGSPYSLAPPTDLVTLFQHLVI
jgi:hypothetical protein